MIKKIVLFFFACLLVFFISVDGKMANAEENSISETFQISKYLENIENAPIVKDIGLIASTIRNTAETYWSIKTKVTSAILYGQNITGSIKQTAEKIINGGNKIKKYIDEKINYFTVKYKINSPLTQTI